MCAVPFFVLAVCWSLLCLSPSGCLSTFLLFVKTLDIRRSWASTNPAGGFLVSPNLTAYEDSQAAVVADVDTMPGQNITCVLKVDKGLLVLAAKTNLGPNSPSQVCVSIFLLRWTATTLTTLSALCSLPTRSFTC